VHHTASQYIAVDNHAAYSFQI